MVRERVNVRSIHMPPPPPSPHGSVSSVSSPGSTSGSPKTPQLTHDEIAAKIRHTTQQIALYDAQIHKHRSRLVLLSSLRRADFPSSFSSAQVFLLKQALLGDIEDVAALGLERSVQEIRLFAHNLITTMAAAYAKEHGRGSLFPLWKRREKVAFEQDLARKKAKVRQSSSSSNSNSTGSGEAQATEDSEELPKEQIDRYLKNLNMDIEERAAEYNQHMETLFALNNAANSKIKQENSSFTFSVMPLGTDEEIAIDSVHAAQQKNDSPSTTGSLSSSRSSSNLLNNGGAANGGSNGGNNNALNANNSSSNSGGGMSMSNNNNNNNAANNNSGSNTNNNNNNNNNNNSGGSGLSASTANFSSLILEELSKPRVLQAPPFMNPMFSQHGYFAMNSPRVLVSPRSTSFPPTPTAASLAANQAAHPWIMVDPSSHNLFVSTPPTTALQNFSLATPDAAQLQHPFHHPGNVAQGNQEEFDANLHFFQTTMEQMQNIQNESQPTYYSLDNLFQG